MLIGRWRRVAALVSVLAVTACASTSNVTSVRDPHYTGLLHVLFIGVREGAAPGYAERLAAHLRTELARHRVLSTVRVLRAGTVNTKDFLAEVGRAKPEGLLLVQLTHDVAKRGVPMILTYEAVLTHVKEGDHIWNARVVVRRATGADGTADEFMTEVARQVTHRLAVNRLIESTPEGD